MELDRVNTKDTPEQEYAYSFKIATDGELWTESMPKCRVILTNPIFLSQLIPTP